MCEIGDVDVNGEGMKRFGGNVNTISCAPPLHH